MATKMDDQLTVLEKEYCPPIDSALFYAIISDFDLSKPELLRSARVILDEIKASAEAEESLAFDPSGSSNVPDLESSHQGSQEQVRSGSGDRLTSSDDTDLTSLTASTQSLRLDGSTPGASSPRLSDYDYGIEKLPVDAKLAILAESFPDLKSFDISHTLTSCGNNVEKAIDELLTRSFFENAIDSDGEVLSLPKGIEGFVHNGTHRRKRKGKAKKKRKPNSPEDGPHSAPDSPISGTFKTTNTWISAKENIEFITQNTNMPLNTVTSVYHKSSGSVRKTILTLSETYIDRADVSVDEDAAIQVSIAELGVDFPTIPTAHLRGIVRLTHPSTASAHSLAKAYLSPPSSTEQSDLTKTSLTPQYIRPALDKDEASETFTVVQRSRPSQRARATDGENAKLLAANYSVARATAFAQATAAYRKSRSNPLMGGAAAYYAQLGHDAQASVDSYSAAAADALVSRHSTPNQIDLHGVDVKNAIRIAGERVQSWWDSGQGEWAREGKVMGAGGFSIVTGVGKHSQGGRGRLGPAVRKALAQDGWRIEEESGVLTVLGRARR